MDVSAFQNLLFAAQGPALPSPMATRLALHGVWAIVLGSAAMLAVRQRARVWRWGLGLLVLLWTLLPGSLSPAYWLGLAFQTPSSMSAVICVACVLKREGLGQDRGAWRTASGLHAQKILTLAGIALGWVLLLDTLACLPVSVYAWGFGAGALAALLVLAALLWLVLGSVAAALPFCVLSLFVLTRLPSGNVWDALLDPWLWLALQAGALVSVLRHWLTRRRLSAATRA